jgi:hypothetical protein
LNIKNYTIKKILSLFTFFLIQQFYVNAQSVYFDVGLGADYNISTIIYNEDDINNSYFSYMGINLGFKAGYCPFNNLPLYFVIGYENIYGPIGPGVVFYPIPLVQLGLSFGLPIGFFSGNFGFAWDTSFGVNLGKNNHGVLFGIKYWGLTQKYKNSGDYGDQIINNAFGLFIKYVYKKTRK